MRKNRILFTCFVLMLCMGLISGCGKKENSASKAGEGKIRVVCTTFPQYDWTKALIGEEADRYDLTLLLDDGADLHNYQPTAEDIAKIADCDLFIYVGGESDRWVNDALKEATNKNMQVINLLDVLGEKVKEEEVVEGMQEEEHDHEVEAGEDQEETEYDEHVWLSLKNAQVIVNRIEQSLSEIDREHAKLYKDHADHYRTELQNLDREYETVVQSAKKKTLLFGDRFPFRYMTDDYGLDYYAAFVGCSAETEASFETIAFLSGKIEELKIPVILVIENSDRKIAEAMKRNTKEKNQQIEVMNSLQSVTSTDIKNGFSYLSAMKDNLEVLKQALN